MEGVRDEVVAQHDRRLVVVQPIDRLAPASVVRFVEDIVMHQSGHVDHLEHRREPLQVFRFEDPEVTLGRRQSGYERERRAEHLAAIPAHMPAQGFNGRKLARQLPLKNRGDLFKRRHQGL